MDGIAAFAMLTLLVCVVLFGAAWATVLPTIGLLWMLGVLP